MEDKTGGALHVTDELGAIALCEALVSSRIFWCVEDARRASWPRANAFEEPLTVERGDAISSVKQARIAAEAGERVALVASASALVAARSELRAIRAQRLGIVVHAISGTGPEAADVFALADLGWGAVLACGAEDAFDLALLARRAAEDSGTPFFVIHERAAHLRLSSVVMPPYERVRAYAGAKSARLKKITDPAHPSAAKESDRAFAERVPFALGSAMRELDMVTGRRHRAIDRFPNADSALMLVGVGPIGDALIGEAEAMRAAGGDVGALRLTVLRPFPGADLAKALARAHTMTVIEVADDPLAQSGFLTREIKSAFADAITWAPGYPGVGRVPNIVSGALGHVPLEETDVDHAVKNMLAHEVGKRAYVFDSNAMAKDAPVTRRAPQSALSMRVHAGSLPEAENMAESCVRALAMTLGLEASATIRSMPEAEGEGIAVDIAASTSRPRGVLAPRMVRVVCVLDARALANRDPLSRLEPGGVLVIASDATSAEALFASLPQAARATIDERAIEVHAIPKAHGADVLAVTAALAVSLASPGARVAPDRARLPLDVVAAARTSGSAAESLARRVLLEPIRRAAETSAKHAAATNGHS